MTHSASLKTEADDGYSEAFIALIAICAMALIYVQTFQGMVQVWMNAVTFRHGLVIIPISAWLIWRRRAVLAKSRARPNWWSLPLLLALTVGWLLGKLTDVNVVQELAMIAMVPALVVLILGSDIFRLLRFPLLYLFFAVPIGWFLVPPLMHMTASMAVQGLGWSGVPVFQDGFRISVPTGNFLVATACSGIRYLIACLALGTLFAYLFYRSWWRKILFMVLAFIVPILANGIRAYGIILLAYLSDMRIATGFDHEIYGFIFFSVILFLMFGLGSLFREDFETSSNLNANVKVSRQKPARLPEVGIAAAAGILLVALGPISGAMAQRLESAPAAVHGGMLFAGAQPWKGPTAISGSWRPKFVGDHKELAGRYQNGSRGVDVFVEQYPYPHQGVGVVSSLNRIAGKPDEMVSSNRGTITFAGGKVLNVTETLIQSGGVPRVIWSWYQVGDRTTTNRMLEKTWEAFGLVRGRRGWARWISVSTPVTMGMRQARSALEQFLRDNYASLLTCLGPRQATAQACSQ